MTEGKRGCAGKWVVKKEKKRKACLCNRGKGDAPCRGMKPEVCSSNSRCQMRSLVKDRKVKDASFLALLAPPVMLPITGLQKR